MDELTQKRLDHVQEWAKFRVAAFKRAGLPPSCDDVSGLSLEDRQHLEWFDSKHQRLSAEADGLRKSGVVVV